MSILYTDYLKRVLVITIISTSLLAFEISVFPITNQGGNLPATIDLVFTPSNLLRGKDYNITIHSARADNTKATECASDAELKVKDIKKVTFEPVGVEIGSIVISAPSLLNSCVVTATLTVKPDAQVGEVVIKMKEKVQDSENLLGTAKISVLSVAQGAIPPGLAPKVDVMWGVLPAKICSDSFGRSVADNYYCIEIVIGNNTGYELQLASIGFQTNFQDGSTATVKDSGTTVMNTSGGTTRIYPNTGYRTVRATLEKEQQEGLRAITINVIRAIGPVFTGFGALVKKSSSDYSRLVDIFNNPFEKGLESAWPDTTLRHLQSLDDRTLRDNVVIPNNIQTRTLIFIARELVDSIGQVTNSILLKKKPGSDITIKDATSGESYQIQSIPTKKRAIVHPHDVDYAYVYNALGKIVLIGDTVQHIDRIHVTGLPVDQQQPPPSISGNPTPNTLVRGQATHVVILGDNLQNTLLGGPSGITFENVVIDKNGKSVQADVSATATAALGSNRLVVSTPGGATTAEIIVNAPGPALDDAVAPLSVTNQDKSLKFTGRNLTNAEITVLIDGANFPGNSKSTDTTLILTFSDDGFAKLSTGTHKVTLTIKTSASGGQQITKEFGFQKAP